MTPLFLKRRQQIKVRRTIDVCEKQNRQFKANSYPLCHLLLQKRFNYSKDAFENPGLVNYVDGLDSDWKPILWRRKETAFSLCQMF